jgi:hypothetical protein
MVLAAGGVGAGQMVVPTPGLLAGSARRVRALRTALVLPSLLK